MYNRVQSDKIEWIINYEKEEEKEEEEEMLHLFISLV